MGNLEPDKAAAIIRGVLGVKRKKQIELAKKIGINRVLLNMFLNRKVNLLPADIELILEELDVNVKDVLLSATIDQPNEEKNG